jgi:hypothetical protein
MVITKEVQVEDIPLASGGFTDLRHGIYMGHLVAVKTLRVEEQHAFLKTKKVNITGIVSANYRLNRSVPASLQRGRSLEHIIPSERLETYWSSGGYRERKIHHRIRVDAAWKHHGVCQKFSREQTGTGARLRLLRHSLHLSATIVARSSSGSEVPPWRRSHARWPQRGQ